MFTGTVKQHLLWIITFILLTVTAGDTSAKTAKVVNQQEKRLETPTLPGDGTVVIMARATWDTGWFQTEIFKQLLEILGYQVDGPKTMDNRPFYLAADRGEIDLWVNGWFPSHYRYFKDPKIKGNLELIGFQVKAGALQGYLIDKKSAEKYDINNLGDFKDPQIARLFDTDGNEKADLIGCNQGWACGKEVARHLKIYGLESTVEQIQSDYTPMISEMVMRYKNGEPIFFFTWTPNWTIGKLVPGKDTVWLEVPSSSVAGGESPLEIESVVKHVTGCTTDPCSLGFPPSDIRVVANSGFLNSNPVVRRLAESVKIPYEDINAQNALMVDGEDEQEDIKRHASEWIRRNRSLTDQWLRTANNGMALPTKTMTPVTDAEAGTHGQPLRVAVKLLEPFVTYQNRNYSGFSIDLWRKISAEMGTDFTFYGVNTVAKQLDEVRRGAADLAIAGIGITSKREQHLDFSHPFFESGLQIMVTQQSDTLLGPILFKVWSMLLSPGLLYGVGFFLLIVLVAAHIVWFLERDRNPQFSSNYLTGLWQSIWWAVVTVTTVGYGDKTPQGWKGRLFGLFWILAGYFVFAYFTASVTTTVAVNELRGTINELDDLFGKKVATVDNSPASEFLNLQGVNTVTVEEIKKAYHLLERGVVDAVVYDAPVLQHYALKEGKGRVTIVGAIFQEQSYGIACQESSPLREKINVALLKMVENGEYQVIYDKWFDG